MLNIERKIDGRTVCFVDLTFSELLKLKDADAGNAKQVKVKALEEERIARGHHSSWRGVSSHEEIDDLVANGWQEGMRRALDLKKEIEHLAPRPISVRRRQRWADEGDELSYDRLYTGQMDTMWRTARRESTRSPRTLSLVAEVGGVNTLRTDQIFWAGASVLALADLLEIAGYSVDISVMFHGLAPNNKHMVYRVRLKEAGETLRADVIATGACHAAAFRVYGFEAMNMMNTQIGNEYGSPTNLSTILPSLESEGLVEKTDVLVHRITNRSAAVAELTRIVERVNAGMAA